MGGFHHENFSGMRSPAVTVADAPAGIVKLPGQAERPVGAAGDIGIAVHKISVHVAVGDIEPQDCQFAQVGKAVSLRTEGIEADIGVQIIVDGVNPVALYAGGQFADGDGIGLGMGPETGIEAGLLGILVVGGQFAVGIITDGGRGMVVTSLLIHHQSWPNCWVPHPSS